MARLFCIPLNSFKTRDEGKKEFKKKVFIAFEGVVTEPDYFNKLQGYLNTQDKYSVEIYPVIRNKQDGKSHPTHIRNGIMEFYEENKSSFIPNKDMLCIIFDIDQHFGTTESTKKSKYSSFLNTLSITDKVSIIPYVLNPCFELWLYLEYVKPENMDLGKVALNKKISKKLTYLKTEYNKLKRNNPIDSIHIRINESRKNSKSILLEKKLTDLYKNVGTNINELFDLILNESI